MVSVLITWLNNSMYGTHHTIYRLIHSITLLDNFKIFSQSWEIWGVMESTRFSPFTKGEVFALWFSVVVFSINQIEQEQKVVSSKQFIAQETVFHL